MNLKKTLASMAICGAALLAAGQASADTFIECNVETISPQADNPAYRDTFSTIKFSFNDHQIYQHGDNGWQNACLIPNAKCVISKSFVSVIADVPNQGVTFHSDVTINRSTGEYNSSISNGNYPPSVTGRGVCHQIEAASNRKF